MRYDVNFRYTLNGRRGAEAQDKVQVEAPSKPMALFAAGYAAAREGVRLSAVTAITVSPVRESETAP